MTASTTTSAGTSASTATVSATDLVGYRTDGYLVIRGMLDAAEVADIKARFDELAQDGDVIPGHWEPRGGDDPLDRFPRVMHPHRFDPKSRDLLIDPRFRDVLRQLLDDDPLAVQTMFYFKPPGSRGQAFHQDNYYLRVQPFNCIAAWIAIDPSTPENGGLALCPGTQDLDIACPEHADPSVSFTQDFVAPPAGHEPRPLWLEPGDVLFFNGSVVHGSQPNSTPDQWRRSFISHYMPAAATHIGAWYLDHAIDFDGRSFAREINGAGGPCGDDVKPGGEYH